MFKFCLFLVFFSGTLIAADMGVKEKISMTQKKLEGISSEVEISNLHYQLSLYYFEDQEIDKAFHHFLLALKGVPEVSKREISEEEKKIYEEALDYYLTAGSDSEKIGRELLSRYKEMCLTHPEYAHLNFLISVAHANLGEFRDFFELFYKFYPELKDSFLAYKTQGILCLRLSQRTSDKEKKVHYQKEAIQLIKVALEKNGKDPSLYKILIALAKDEKNETLILSYIKKMLNAEAHINRSDVYIYVREAVLLREYELAQKIIDVASNYYEFSRAITEAQEYLNHERGI